MPFQTDPDAIRWRLHLTAPIASVYHALSTDTGRATFWAQAAHERNGVIHFVFPNRMTWDATILEAVPPHRYCIRYIGDSVTIFDLTDDGHGGTDLTVIDSGVPARDRAEVIAGWVSVLIYLKALIDFGVDLRAHDPALMQACPAERLILRLGRSLLKQPETLSGLADGLTLAGPPPHGAILFHENGLVFEAEPLLGQKTGFFLDQRENRARVETLAQGKSVLNIFAYTGGFSVYAARGGARQVVSVDISAPAMQAAVRNMQHNRHIPTVAAAAHETLAEDAFEVLARMGQEKRRFDLVIIDPPMFAHNQSQVSTALSAYQRLTRLGLAVLNPGGVLVQASCSSQVSSQDFFEAINRAARESGRPLQEIERSGHALDHPVNFPEGAYLKCLFARAT